ncbi:MAG TPA: hypothetical protein VK824_09350 [Planctomycetota bacterium]|nr:hypothetical protein [Planctomycetota bacterium]
MQALSAQVDALTRQVQSLSSTTVQLQSELAAARAAAPGEEAQDYYIPRLAGSFEESGLSANLGNVYTKPYLTNLGKRTYLGGYIDLIATNPAGSDKKKNFRPERFVPFIYSDVSDRVKFASEIEIEDGHEVEVEFAHVDYLMTRAANFRAGIELLPLGKFNEVHDSPIQELTDRPLVDTFIIPTTLRDAGVGLYGDLSDEVSYQFTLTNGFRGLDAAGNNVITAEDGLAEARPHEFEIGEQFQNQNDKLAYTQRVAWKPELGMEFGASALFDSYDENGDNSLNIYALDATLDGKAVGFLPDQLELLGEAGWAAIERDDFAKANGVAGDMNGWYAQANWHCDPTWLTEWKQNGTLEEDAHFTLVARYDDVSLDTYDRRRTTFGVNFRPNAHDTVFKLDYQFNDDAGSEAGANDEDALLFSVATYF